MHSLRPCLTVFVIVFALSVGATQSESAGEDIQVTCADPTQKFSFTFIFNTTGKNENLELSGTEMGSKYSEKIENFIYQKDVNALMFGLKGKTFTYLIKLDKAQLLENFKLNENVICVHKKILKKNSIQVLPLRKKTQWINPKSELAEIIRLYMDRKLKDKNGRIPKFLDFKNYFYLSDRKLGEFAKEGNVFAQAFWAARKSENLGIDFPKPVFNKLFLLAKKGDVAAQFYVNYLAEGSLLVIDYEKELFSLLKRAAEQGFANSIFPEHNASFLYAVHPLFHKQKNSFKTVLKWMTKAANQGSIEAMIQLGIIYEKGEIFKGEYKDYKQAMYWTADYKKAMYWYKKAAEQSKKRTFYTAHWPTKHLGDKYRDGVIVARDMKKAVKWYIKALEQGYDSGGLYYEIGEIFEKGKGIPVDYEKAFKWYTKGSKLKSDQGISMFNLGRMYSKGLGILKDKVQAHMWYNLASFIGKIKNASKNRDDLEKKMTPSQIEKATDLAREWLVKYGK